MKQIYENINSMLKRYVFSDTVNTKVLKNIHGDSSGVRGAADLGRTNDINWNYLHDEKKNWLYWNWLDGRTNGKKFA